MGYWAGGGGRKGPRFGEVKFCLWFGLGLDKDFWSWRYSMRDHQALPFSLVA